MALISSGIERVRAFELPGGIWEDGGYVGMPRIVLVRWWSAWSDKFYQIYVNGKYAGVTVDGQQRQMIVQIPTSLESPVRIEVFAVEAEQADADFSSEIDSLIDQSGRVRISVLRGQDIPIGATARVYFDNGTGEIDYDKALNDSPIRVWPAWQDKAGFGMSRFGASDFGYDSAAAVGFGRGSFGHGQFGQGADTFEWTGPPLCSGIYTFAVKVTDEAGNESSASETDQVMVTPAPRPTERISISSFDKQTNQLVLSVS
ncbi:MAG: hypothetical protein AMJ75_02135 [Phycisphaerae bacterium SM1_79]|nr:MAG: hypothetical protein AMJ75_02135 [Phycisphaerae bacterium SM1_79]